MKKVASPQTPRAPIAPRSRLRAEPESVGSSPVASAPPEREPAKEGDGFELKAARAAFSGAPAKGTVPPSRMSGGAMHVLDAAKDPGVYFREQGREDGHTEDDEDPELAEAVEEAIRILFGVRGIHHIGPGQNEAGAPVVLISVSRGFTAASMQVIPERVHRFPTLVALPFELLPLKRESH